MKHLFTLVLLLGITSCADTGRYSQRTDSKPTRLIDNVDFKDVTPKYEPYLHASMRPYKVLGQHYVPLKTGKGYEKEGIASWYGQKFHGHLTANGEIYNMFTMTAAHKTLPLPSIVRVTNLSNGKQAVVRVNDRGPFHQNRIIDLSYAAAMKIGVLDTGTAHVKVEVLHVDESGVLTVGKGQPSESTTQLAKNEQQQIFIQVAALQDQERAERLATGLKSQYQVAVNAANLDGLYRLRMGPLINEIEANQLLQKLKQDGFENAFRVFTAP
ncbi:septal ring lytic transglycosylase RlpA family protein [Aliiglaciecola litoralis]|uniref:Endolytic peptidoglycan transglycosylase RlpA n=1 Tax=Aliiglaciecola litoralis TaxID=582857 RepID=A0ABN1LLD3_9ALTE